MSLSSEKAPDGLHEAEPGGRLPAISHNVPLSSLASRLFHISTSKSVIQHSGQSRNTTCALKTMDPQPNTTAASVPTTPQPSDRQPRNPLLPPNRRLWASPAFSDYFSGEENDDPYKDNVHDKQPVGLDAAIVAHYSPDIFPGTAPSVESFPATHQPPQLPRLVASSSFPTSLIRAPTPLRLHSALVTRMGSIRQALLYAPDISEHHCQRLHADLDRLERTLHAPDAQTREPAEGEGEGQGLFEDDSGSAESSSSSASASENVNKSGQEHKEKPASKDAEDSNALRDVVARVATGTMEMKQHFTILEVRFPFQHNFLTVWKGDHFQLISKLFRPNIIPSFP